MSYDDDNLYQVGMYHLSCGQPDFLLAVLSSNQKQANFNPNHNPQITQDPSPDQNSSKCLRVPPSGGFGLSEDERSFLDSNPGVDFELLPSANLIRDMPRSRSPNHELDKKRKSIDSKSDIEAEEMGKKRRKRKAQIRAAQLAFRKRKEKHLKDLEAKVVELQKSSDSAIRENGLLRAKVERLQAALCKCRKRLSWRTSSTGISYHSASPSAHFHRAYASPNNESLSDFHKLCDPLGSHRFNEQADKNDSEAQDNFHRPSDMLIGGHSTRRCSAGNSMRSNANKPTRLNTVKSTATTWSSGTPSSHCSAETPYNVKFSDAPAHNTFNPNSPPSSSDSYQIQMLSFSGKSSEPNLNSPQEANSHDAYLGNSCSVHRITINNPLNTQKQH